MGNSARIVHLALKGMDLERATLFYEQVFGFRQTGTGHARGHVSRHMTDGAFDLALMVYDSEDEHEAQLSGPGPCIHHFGIEVADRETTIAAIRSAGGEIVSEPDEGALKFRAPDGVVAEIVRPGRYRKAITGDGARISGLSIGTPDIRSASEFYKTVFGFKEQPGDPGALELSAGEFRLQLLQRAGIAARHHHWTIATGKRADVSAAVLSHGGTKLSGGGLPLYSAPDGSLVSLV